MAAALDDVGKAAWTAELAKQYGKYKLRPAAQALLVDHLAAEGEALAEAGLDVTKDDVQEWETIWEGTLADAGVGQKRDLAIFLAWGKARCSVAVRATAAGPGNGAADAAADDSSRSNDHAGRALRVLEGSGVVIPESVRAKLVKDFEENAAGDYQEQCSNAVTVFILYLGRMPTAEEIRWWDRDYKLGGGANGGKIDITRSEGYVKMHNKTSEGDVLTLARALKNETRFSAWVVTTMEALSKAGKPLACVQLTKVLLQADKNSAGNWAVKSAYLHGYFFEEYLGIGMPQVTALNSALHALASGPRGSKEKPLSEVVPSGSRSDPFGSLPGSASQVGTSDVSSAITALQDMMREALAPIKELKEGKGASEKAGRKARAGADEECAWCGRTWCAYLKGGDMCRAAERSLKLLRSNPREKKEDAKEPEKEA